MLTEQSSVTFWNGHKMPLVGFGTYLRQSPLENTEAAVNWALEAGYRHIDTAYFYQTEAAIGRVLREWITSGRVKREELFITTKLPFIGGNHPDRVEHYMKVSLENLGLDYVDLYLIHAPIAILAKDDGTAILDENGFFALDKSLDLVALWKAMEAQVDAGRAKSIGLSNCNSKQIERIVQSARIKPANLQVEVHAYFQQKPLRAFCAQHGITVCAYGSLGSSGRVEENAKRGFPAPQIPAVMEDPVVLAIAQKHSKKPSQVLLRHLIQQDVVIIPKSVSQNRIQDNFKLFDFSLSEDEMKQLNGLDKNLRTFTFHLFPGMEKYPEYPYNIPY